MILGRGLARALGVARGDKVAFITSTASGGMSGAEGVVRGVFSTGVKAYDDLAVRMPLPMAQQLARVKGVQLWVVRLDDTSRTDAVAQEVERIVSNSGMEVRTWYQLSDFYRKTVTLMSRQMTVVAVLIAVILVLGIANLLTMSTLERTGEIGTMLAMGTSRRSILRMHFAEGVLLGGAGAIAGRIDRDRPCPGDLVGRHPDASSARARQRVQCTDHGGASGDPQRDRTGARQRRRGRDLPGMEGIPDADRRCAAREPLIDADADLDRRPQSGPAAHAHVADPRLGGLGVVSLILARGFVDDVLWQLREATIRSQLGHFQVFAPGYVDGARREPLAHTLAGPLEAIAALHAIAGVDTVAPRLSFPGSLSNGRGQVPVIVEGVDPAAEARIGTALTMVAGVPLERASGPAVIVGEGVARCAGAASRRHRHPARSDTGRRAQYAGRAAGGRLPQPVQGLRRRCGEDQARRRAGARRHRFGELAGRASCAGHLGRKGDRWRRDTLFRPTVTTSAHGGSSPTSTREPRPSISANSSSCS